MTTEETKLEVLARRLRKNSDMLNSHMRVQIEQVKENLIEIADKLIEEESEATRLRADRDGLLKTLEEMKKELELARNSSDNYRKELLKHVNIIKT